MKATPKYLIALVLLGLTMPTLWAQNRLFLEFEQTQGSPLIMEGLRIKKTLDSQQYWLMGRATVIHPSGTDVATAVARFDPYYWVAAPHAYYTMPNGVYGTSTSEDFVVENNSITTTGSTTVYSTPSTHMNLLTIQPNLMPAGPNHRYNINTWMQDGKAIVHKTDMANGGPAYIIASDVLDGSNGTYGTVVTSVSTITMLPNWQIYIPSPVCPDGKSTNTFVWDMIRDANGDYYIVGDTRCDGQASGVIIKVNQNGTYNMRRHFPYPLGGELQFFSVSMAPGTPSPRYVISGRVSPISPARKSVYVGVFDINANNIVSHVYSVPDVTVIPTRHTMTVDNDPFGSVNHNIVIAGTMWRDYRMGQRSTGTLLRLLYRDDPQYPLGWYCGALDWKEYGYLDTEYGYMNIALNDVTQRVRNTPPLGGEVAAIGHTIGWRKDNGTGAYQDYMLFMETDYTMSSDIGSGCYSEAVNYQCREITFTPSTPMVVPVYSTNYTNPLPMGTNYREPFYYCGNMFYMYKSSTEEEPQPTKGYTTDLQLSPLPNDGGLSSLTLTLSESDHVSIDIYDAAGAKVLTVASQYFKAGNHNLSFDCSTLPSGMYALRVMGSSINKSLMMPVVR